MSSHYRSPLTYSEAALEAAERGLVRLRQAVRDKLGENEPTGEMVTETYKKRFIEAMDDDFNTPRALATMFDLAHDVNRLSEAGYGVALAQQVLLDMAGVLGLTLKPPEEAPLDISLLEQILLDTGERVRKGGLKMDIAASVLDADSIMRFLISARNQLREAKQYQLADEIRARLDKLGITLEDTPQGTVWTRKR